MEHEGVSMSRRQQLYHLRIDGRDWSAAHYLLSHELHAVISGTCCPRRLLSLFRVSLGPIPGALRTRSGRFKTDGTRRTGIGILRRLAVSSRTASGGRLWRPGASVRLRNPNRPGSAASCAATGPEGGTFEHLPQPPCVRFSRVSITERRDGAPQPWRPPAPLEQPSAPAQRAEYQWRRAVCSVHSIFSSMRVRRMSPSPVCVRRHASSSFPGVRPRPSSARRRRRSQARAFRTHACPPAPQAGRRRI